MASALVLFTLTLLAGYLSRRFGRLSEEAADVLNRFVIDLCVPATILRVIPQLTLKSDLLLLALVPWLMAGLAFVVSQLASRALQLDRHTRTALFVCTGLGNTSFLGFPLCSALLGERSVPLAAVYDQLGSFLLLSTVGIWTVARAAGAQEPSARDMLKRIATFPPFIALLLALIPFTHPLWLDDVLTKIGAALIPVAMFGVGLRTRLTPPENPRVFVLALALKLVLFPLIALLIAHLSGATGLLRSVLVLETAMPSMITAGALLMSQRIAPRLAAALVGWGIVLSMATLPVWAYFLRD